MLGLQDNTPDPEDAKMRNIAEGNLREALESQPIIISVPNQRLKRRVRLRAYCRLEVSAIENFPLGYTARTMSYMHRMVHPNKELLLGTIL